METWGFKAFFWFVVWAEVDAAIKEREPIFHDKLTAVIAQYGGEPTASKE